MIHTHHAKVIFIDNLGREQGVAGLLSLSERVQWIENRIGIARLNGVITTEQEESELPNYIQVLRRNLQADDVSYRHDRYKLSKSINELVGLLG